MKNKKVRHLPYHKTYRRRQQLEMEEAEAMLKKGRLKGWIGFIGFMVIILAAIVGVLVLTTFTSDLVKFFMGVK